MPWSWLRGMPLPAALPPPAPRGFQAQVRTEATGLDLVSTSAGFLDCGKSSLKSRANLRQTVADGICMFAEFSYSQMLVAGPQTLALRLLSPLLLPIFNLLGLTFFQRWSELTGRG